MRELKKLTLNEATTIPKEKLKHLLGGFSDDIMLADYQCDGASPCQDGCKEGSKTIVRKIVRQGKSNKLNSLLRICCYCDISSS